MITFKSNKGTLSREELSESIIGRYGRPECCTIKCCKQYRSELVEIPVDVRVIHMDWFYRNNQMESFIDFATIMNG